MYGLNNTEIPTKPRTRILLDEVLSPFYIFQFFSIVLWMLLPYYVYAIVIMFTSIASAVATLLEAERNQMNLKKMSFFETPVLAYRFS